MSRIITLVLFIFLSTFSFNLYAQQQGGGGGDDLKWTCELTGGTWTGQEGGNWACCWADWGCYGCHSGSCRMVCRTKRCRDANGMRNDPPKGTKVIKQLAPTGQIAPVVPVRPKKKMTQPSPSSAQ